MVIVDELPTTQSESARISWVSSCRGCMSALVPVVFSLSERTPPRSQGQGMVSRMDIEDYSLMGTSAQSYDSTIYL